MSRWQGGNVTRPAEGGYCHSHLRHDFVIHNSRKCIAALANLCFSSLSFRLGLVVQIGRGEQDMQLSACLVDRDFCRVGGDCWILTKHWRKWLPM